MAPYDYGSLVQSIFTLCVCVCVEEAADECIKLAEDLPRLNKTFEGALLKCVVLYLLTFLKNNASG